jgi:hypothetical protein
MASFQSIRVLFRSCKKKRAMDELGKSKLTVRELQYLLYTQYNYLRQRGTFNGKYCTVYQQEGSLAQDITSTSPISKLTSDRDPQCQSTKYDGSNPNRATVGSSGHATGVP